MDLLNGLQRLLERRQRYEELARWFNTTPERAERLMEWAMWAALTKVFRVADPGALFLALKDPRTSLFHPDGITRRARALSLPPDPGQPPDSKNRVPLREEIIESAGPASSGPDVWELVDHLFTKAMPAERDAMIAILEGRVPLSDAQRQALRRLRKRLAGEGRVTKPAFPAPLGKRRVS
jgi:hypothetical protein